MKSMMEQQKRSSSKEVLILETLPESKNHRGCESDEGADSDEVILEDDNDEAELVQYDTRL